MTHGEVYRLNKTLRAEGKKFCNTCERTLLLADFAISTRDVRSPKCRECHNTYTKVHREANLRAYSARSKAYREAHLEVISAKAKAYRETNREVISAKKKEDYKANREAVLARVKKYADAHREDIRQYKARLFTKFKQSLATRIACLRHTAPAFREARIQEILDWAGESHSYWVESEIQNATN